MTHLRAGVPQAGGQINITERRERRESFEAFFSKRLAVHVSTVGLEKRIDASARVCGLISIMGIDSSTNFTSEGIPRL